MGNTRNHQVTFSLCATLGGYKSILSGGTKSCSFFATACQLQVSEDRWRFPMY